LASQLFLGSLQLRQSLNLFVGAKDGIHSLLGKWFALGEFLATAIQNGNLVVKDHHGELHSSEGILVAEDLKVPVDPSQDTFAAGSSL